jgi:hypothetical protein
MTVAPKNEKRQLILVAVDGTEDRRKYRHILLRVKLKNGEEYALDLAGAQYGYYEPVTPWVIYETSRIAMNYGTLDNLDMVWGSGKAKLLKRIEERKGTATGNVLIINSATSAIMMIATREWEAKSNISTGKLLILPQKDFEQKGQELVNYFGKNLQSYLDSILEGDKQRYAALAAGTQT